MADDDKDQKTEPATPKRRAEAFKRGQFARSPDVQVAFTLTAALVVMLFSLPDIARALRDFGIYSFQNLGRTTLSNEVILSRLDEAGRRCLELMSPLLIPVLGRRIPNESASWGTPSMTRIVPGYSDPVSSPTPASTRLGPSCVETGFAAMGRPAPANVRPNAARMSPPRSLRPS